MFACEYCQRISGHNIGCPDYEPKKSRFKCSICEEEIINGEEYIVNNDYDYAHWDCVSYGRELAEWLGFEIQKMEDDYDYGFHEDYRDEI